MPGEHAMSSLRHIDDALFTEVDGEVHLRGTRCAACGIVAFPAQASCPSCTGVDVVALPLPRRGTLWSWTTQHFPPKPPYRGVVDGFRPYHVGYVELPDHVMVEAVLVGTDGRDLAIGQPMRLELWPFRRSDGSAVQAFGFAPA
jgi:uncharacterized protein